MSPWKRCRCMWQSPGTVGLPSWTTGLSCPPQPPEASPGLPDTVIVKRGAALHLHREAPSLHSSPHPNSRPQGGRLEARGGGEEGPCLCAGRGHPCLRQSSGPWRKRRGGDKTELQVGDIQVRELPGALAWVRSNRVLARAAMMRKNFLSLCPGLHD